MKNTEEFRKALEHKNLPLLVLDQKWHRLFAIHGKTEDIQNTETQLNNLLARQGRLNSDLKGYKKVKNQLTTLPELSIVYKSLEKSVSGCGSVWLEHLVWDQGVASSNLVTPTIDRPSRMNSRWSFLCFYSASGIPFLLFQVGFVFFP